MLKIGLLSDTHAWWDDKYAEYFAECDEIWHAGDIGSDGLAAKLAALKPFRAVYGNIDGGMMRRVYPETDVFTCEGVKVLMTHIGGYPGHYDMRIKSRLLQERPKLFVCGHSHIAKVMYDRKLACLHINPGAAGRYGFHKVRTAVRFVIRAGEIKDLELIEYERN